MNTRRLSMLSLMLVAAAGLTPSAPDAAANAAAPQSPAAIPLVFDTWMPGPCSPNGQPQGQCPPGDLFRVRLVTVADGLRSPRNIAFTPDGGILITELAGRVRIVSGGVLLPEPLAGWPATDIEAGALQAAIVHPQFATNRRVYLYYVKNRADKMTTLALARARLEGAALSDVREIFVADAWVQGGPIAGRAVFGPDGMIYLTVNDHDPNNANENESVRIFAQHLDSDVGKVLRITDEGGIPADNPFVGRRNANPQVFTYGHRNLTDFAWHPMTGELWATEIGPMGGDEINILRPGQNYGWPFVSLGKLYNKKDISRQHWYREGMEMPFMHWTPSISPSTLAWYTGDKLAPWRGHLFVGALNGQTLQRVAFDQPAPQAERRDSLFMPLGRRWRHVVQGPDGYLYALTEKRTLGTTDPSDATSGVVYRIEPANGAQATPPASAAASRPTPRALDGRPDLSGFWRGPLLRNMDKNVPGGFKAIFTPAGAAAYQHNLTATINPEGVCLFAGIPRASISGVPFQIVQNPTRMVWLYELMWTFRSIPTDGRALPDNPEPSFFGTSVGRWDGEVFVIESRGFKEYQSWLDDDAHPHSEAMTVVERWWRPDADHLNHEVTVTDPKYYTRPFTFDRVFTPMPAGQELIEFACNENNRDLPRLGFGPHDPEYDKRRPAPK